jgi:hypothetical protein
MMMPLTGLNDAHAYRRFIFRVFCTTHANARPIQASILSGRQVGSKRNCYPNRGIAMFISFMIAITIYGR